MLTDKQVEEVREHLENAKNPVFFYDSDADGLSSFVLLARYIGRGKGVIARNPRESSEAYLRKVEEFGADYVFVLDTPQISPDFIRGVEERNIPVVVMDHHNVPPIETEFYYNTYDVSGKSEPVSYLCYKIANQKKDAWIAAIGCISDYYIPDFFENFAKQNPDLVDCEYKTPFDVVYKCALGKWVKIFNYALKDSMTNVVKFSNFLLKANFAYEVIEENSRTKSFLDKYNEVDATIQKLFEKAKKEISGKLLFFTYSGEMSLSQQLSNQLMYYYPDKVIVVGYRSGGRIKFSLRWFNNIREITLKAIENLPGATGGGHENATGAQMSEEDVEKFRENILSLLK